MKFLDNQIGRIIGHIKESGLWENTVIVFTTDHGDLMGDHGLITKGEKHYDSSVRCPLIVAGGPVKSGITARLTCSLDFYPTFCDWAGIDAALLPPLEGKSFPAVCRGGDENEPWEEIVVSVDECSSVITDDGYRLTRYSSDGDGQMFNLFNDLHEQHNLYHNPDYKDKKIQLLERLVKVLNRPGTISQYRNLPVKDEKKLKPIAASQYLFINCRVHPG